MHLQNFIKIHQLVHKIFSINKISTSIKGHNSVENERKILFNHPNLNLVNIHAYTKFDRNPQNLRVKFSGVQICFLRVGFRQSDAPFLFCFFFFADNRGTG